MFLKTGHLKMKRNLKSFTEWWLSKTQFCLTLITLWETAIALFDLFKIKVAYLCGIIMFKLICFQSKAKEKKRATGRVKIKQELHNLFHKGQYKEINTWVYHHKPLIAE